MSTKEIIKKLEFILGTKNGVAAKRVEDIEVLLAELGNKKIKFQAKLEGATTSKDIAKAERKLAVCNAQIDKGRAAIKELLGDN